MDSDAESTGRPREKAAAAVAAKEEAREAAKEEAYHARDAEREHARMLEARAANAAWDAANFAEDPEALHILVFGDRG